MFCEVLITQSDTTNVSQNCDNNNSSKIAIFKLELYEFK